MSGFEAVQSAGQKKSTPFALKFLGGFLALGAATAGGFALLSQGAHAEDGPAIRQTLQQFNRIQRAEPAPQSTISYAAPPARGLIPTIFRSPPRQDTRALGFAPINAPVVAPQRYVPRNAGLPDISRSLPVGALEHGASGLPTSPRNSISASSRRKAANAAGQPSWMGEGKGLPMGVNYCVRLCDGFAFPVGHAGQGSIEAQEAACQLACPGADVAMYSAPAGAKDIDEAIRNGRPYSALPNAFKYRHAKYDAACTCKAPGATTSVAALLTDFTLRRGDLVMTRQGVRHFDGAQKFPYRAGDFPDALARLTNKKEIEMVRGIEIASLRGNMSVNTPSNVRARVVADLERAERVAARQAAAPARVVVVPRPSRGFEEVSRSHSLTPVRVVNRPQRIVALN